MADKTGIEWTDATWNPIRGCSRVSEGCRNCYAEKVAYRFSDEGQAYHGLVGIGGKWNGQIRFVEEHLLDPLKWKKPRRIFVNSMSDLFHENVTDEMLDRIFAVMALSPQHTFQVLTKRPERMLAYLSERTTKRVFRDWAMTEHEYAVAERVREEILRLFEVAPADSLNRASDALDGLYPHGEGYLREWPLPNVWLGVSVENQKAADERIPLLLQTPAAKRFLSAEPLLGPVSLRATEYLKAIAKPGWQGEKNYPFPGMPNEDRSYFIDLLDWVIVGGESGPGARPMHPDWARSLRDQCVTAEVPFFFKQWGEWKPISEMPEPEYDALYVSNKKAPAGEEWCQGEFDEVHGRRCTVAVEYLGYSGETGLERAYQSVNGHGGMMLFRLGKKAAGHLLDGQEWHQFPAVPRG